MTDFYLKFASEEEANAILYTTRKEVVAETDLLRSVIDRPSYSNIDVLGVLYEKPPVDAGEGYVPVALEGWHVNVRVVGDENGTALDAFKVEPKQPRRIWG